MPSDTTTAGCILPLSLYYLQYNTESGGEAWPGLRTRALFIAKQVGRLGMLAPILAYHMYRVRPVDCNGLGNYVQHTLVIFLAEARVENRRRDYARCHNIMLTQCGKYCTYSIYTVVHILLSEVRDTVVNITYTHDLPFNCIE